ncbi:hypothetical protein ACIBQX_07875 [Nonomuraea sp. NPDC049714]|uniref:hypothetical protein n=1 Tax=Nonomuraea sp. NPDC049714 TaxID=3364357 RepID=UPI0037BB4A5E
MRLTPATAALLASAVLGGVAATPPSAHAQTGPSVARAAWIKSCSSGVDSGPCGHWRLILRNGRTITVPDAAATKVDARGRRTTDAGVFAVSGDGRTMLYERASDHRLIVRRVAGGSATELPRSLAPKGTGSITAQLSPAGDRVLVDHGDESGRVPTRVFTVATGRTTELPGLDLPLGFSADGDEVLAQRTAGDNTTALLAHRLDGTSTRRTPPQVVAGAATTTLAADGRTVAAFIWGDAEKKKRPRLRLYDLQTGELSKGVDLALDPASTPYSAHWTADGKLTALVTTDDEGSAAVVRVLTADPGTGSLKQRDTYTIGKSRHAFYAAGETA